MSPPSDKSSGNCTASRQARRQRKASAQIRDTCRSRLPAATSCGAMMRIKFIRRRLRSQLQTRLRARDCCLHRERGGLGAVGQRAVEGKLAPDNDLASLVKIEHVGEFLGFWRNFGTVLARFRPDSTAILQNKAIYPPFSGAFWWPLATSTSMAMGAATLCPWRIAWRR